MTIVGQETISESDMAYRNFIAASSVMLVGSIGVQPAEAGSALTALLKAAQLQP